RRHSLSVLLAHLADIHLGFRQYHRQTPSGINQREADVAKAFQAAVDGIIAARPNIVVIAGDMFQAVRPTNAAIVFAFRQLQRLRDALPDTEIVIIAGNHDTPRSTETGSILRLFSELRIHVVTDMAERIEFDSLDLAVTAVPHQAYVSGERTPVDQKGDAKYEVLLLHGEVDAGLSPLERWWAEPLGPLLDPRDIVRAGWTYTALGHYHVTHEVAPNVWYAGALEYVTLNPWGELAEERKTRVKGKGWLLVDLDSGKVTRQEVRAPRRVIDLESFDAAALSAEEIDALIQKRLGAIKGGYADQIVRLVVYETPRHVVRELDHAAIRSAKAAALHFHLDFRRPEVHRQVGSGAPGQRQTLSAVVREFLGRRLLPERIDRDAFVQRGVELLESVTVEPDRV
ncbi:MAG: metallophosphoesterase, partial [Gemmatimonadota bacterium]